MTSTEDDLSVFVEIRLISVIGLDGNKYYSVLVQNDNGGAMTLGFEPSVSEVSKWMCEAEIISGVWLNGVD